MAEKILDGTGSVASTEAEVPDWLRSTGEGVVATDMTGDPRAGFGASVRFWMPPSKPDKPSVKKIIFLTEADKNPVIWEHQLSISGDFKNWCTCPKVMGLACPICNYSDSHNGKFYRYKAAMFTIIDTSEFKDTKSGEIRKNLKKLFVAKKDVAEKLKFKYESRREISEGRHGLKYAMFQVRRGSDEKSASCGDDFEFMKTLEPAAIPVPPGLDELDYAKLLKPDPERAARLLEMALSGGSGGGTTETSGGGSTTEGTTTKVKYD